MSTYTELKGLRIKYLSSDPSPGTAGDVWYNSTSSALKVYAGIGAWSSGAGLITGRNDLAGFGIQTATACFGGVDATAANNDTEEYNGSGWAAGEDMPSAVYEHGGTGTLTAGLSVGGTLPGGITDATNEYDGTDWAAGGDYPAATIRLQACGTQTAALAAGGGRPTISAVTAEYNGTAWTANPSPSGDLPAAIQYHRMTGILTSAVSFGGGPSGPVTGATATYNGTSWTAQTATLNDTRSRLGGAGETDSSAVAFGGFAPNGTVNTELWDGSSWTEVGNMGTARYALAGTGTATKALGAGGYTSGRLTATEEFNNSFQVVTAGAWASSNNVNTARRQSCGAGIQTASIIMGGYGTAFSNATEEYDGSSWTNATNAPFAVYNAYGGGTQTAFIVTGGDLGPAINAETAEWDGSSWTTTNDHPAARNGASGTGSQTAIVSAGGSPHPTATTFYYDGSSWANQSANLGTARYENTNSSCGTQTAALLVGGAGSPNAPKDEVEEWNGTAWSEQNDISAAARQIATSGIQTLALAYGGETAAPAVLATSLSYDGTNWSTSPALGTARRAAGGLGDGATSTAALASSGHNGSANVANTEEFAAATTADTASTIDFD